MLNRDVVNNARKKLAESIVQHQLVSKRAVERCTKLYTLRKVEAHNLVVQVEQYVNSMKATPAGFEKAIAEYKLNFSTFDHVVVDFDKGVKDIDIKSTAGTGAGVAAGAATALLGPSAAMAVATTFGAASTGTAISALSGAAATNAALAWLGGGALVAGGSGMAAGNALLALAGPVGWALAGTATVGGALYMRRANQKAAGEAHQKRFKVEAEIRSLKASEEGIKQLHNLTKTVQAGLNELLIELRDTLKVTQLKDQPDDIICKLAAMVNHVQNLGQLLVKTVELKVS